MAAGHTVTKTFIQEAGQLYHGKAAAVVPTVFLGLIKMPFLNVSVKATATASEPDNSCILTLDKGQPASHVSLSLNGAPIVNLSGGSIRSNTSIDCNGRDGGLTKVISAASSSGCGTPKPGSMTVPDIYAQLAANIAPQCGTSRPGATWTPGVLPSGPAIKTVSIGGCTEYHILRRSHAVGIRTAEWQRADIGCADRH